MTIKFLQVRKAKGFAIVDEDVFDKIASFDWHVECVSTGKFQIGRRIKNAEKETKFLRLSHVILGLEGKAKVFFRNGNPFDLRKINLQQLSLESNTKGAYIYFDKWRLKHNMKPWAVELSFKGKLLKIGYYATKEAAQTVGSFARQCANSLSPGEDRNALRAYVREWAIKNELLDNSTLFGRPVGYERFKDHFWEVKCENGWVLKHRLIWEKAYGEIPANHYVIFRDGNRNNFNLENLELLANNEFQFRRNLKEIADTYPSNLRPAVEALVILRREIRLERQRKSDAFLNNLSAKEIKKFKQLYPITKNIKLAEEFNCCAYTVGKTARRLGVKKLSANIYKGGFQNA